MARERRPGEASRDEALGLASGRDEAAAAGSPEASGRRHRGRAPLLPLPRDSVVRDARGGGGLHRCCSDCSSEVTLPRRGLFRKQAAAKGRIAALATLTNLGRKTLPTGYSYHRQGSHHAASGWGAIAAAIPAAVYMLQGQEAHAAEMERTFIAIKLDVIQRGLLEDPIRGIALVEAARDRVLSHLHVVSCGISGPMEEQEDL